ncbi:MAG: FHA domain-containing protein [Archangium sp.]
MKKIEEHIPTSIFDTEADQEMQAEYGVSGAEYKPAFLYVERGPGAGQLLEVKQGTVVVGRASVSDLRLQHPSISRRHTQIKRQGEQFFVKDLGSQNGTFVNKTRIATEVEVKPGDSIALGNALLRLRGPLAKGEKLGAPASSTAQSASSLPMPASALLEKAEKIDKKARVSTAVVARPSGPNQKAPSSTALKIAVFAGAVGFSLAAVLAFALVKTMSNGKTEATPTTVATAPTGSIAPDDKQRLIDEAIKRKMAEQADKAPVAAATKPTEDEVTSDDATVKEQPRAPTVVRAPVVAAATPRPAAAKKTAAASKAAAAEEDDDEEETPKSGGGNKRAQILAPYEKGNAEASLDLAKKAGDKELTDKLSRFIASYDAAQDAMMSNNGNAAIANFQKALALDEGLSSGWGKYGAEIRRQLANLYVLVGMQYGANGATEKANTGFQGALKHDPNNARAKSQLAKLQPAGGDDADEKPAAPAKKPAPKASSIDDAFGD